MDCASPSSELSPPPHIDGKKRSWKRNATACARCRARKTKCDNSKPRCTACQSVGAECDDGLRSGQAIYPLDNQAILNRIDLLEKTLLQSSWSPQSELQWTVSHITNANFARDVHTNGTTQPVLFSPFIINVENVLSWPVFQDQYKSYPGLRTILSEERSFRRETTLINCELKSCTRLLNNFFSRIHIKNPILHESIIREWARDISLNGMGWDARCCLVLLVCALGAISSPFTSEATRDHPYTACASGDSQMAEGWFAASQKRIGTLLSSGGGVLESQCFFYSGVYLMHTFRPFAAWRLFIQAVACCQTFQCFSNEDSSTLSAVPSTRDDETRRLSEESMYWTCFKTEFELRWELSLPGCSSRDLSYPTFLPSPPLDSLQKQDQAWYFYLAEISLRRVACQILKKISEYRDGNRFRKLPDLVCWMPIFEDQAKQWSQLLPPEVDIERPDYDDIFRFILRGHLLNCYEIMYWPFLVDAINWSIERDMGLDYLVEKGLQLCTDRIWKNESGFSHRHHGSWLMMRSCTRSALVLIAANRNGQLGELMPLDWKAAVRRVITMLEFWQGQSRDAESRKDILENALRSLEICHIR